MNKNITDCVVAVVGSGNVASHLVKALRSHIKVAKINPRSLENFPENCDIAIISVSDRAIEEVASRIAFKAPLTVHTSGSIPATVLQNKADHYGVFYPMQTFTKGVVMDYSSIPFFVEGDTEQTLSALKSLAALISESVMEADSEKRRLLHLASVFACNFTNHLIHIADTLLQEKGMDYKVLLPLIRQTVNKLSSTSPAESQTGPAARNDLTVVNRHLEMLEDKPQLQNIYKEITDSIITQHELN